MLYEITFEWVGDVGAECRKVVVEAPEATATGWPIHDDDGNVVGFNMVLNHQMVLWAALNARSTFRSTGCEVGCWISTFVPLRFGGEAIENVAHSSDLVEFVANEDTCSMWDAVGIDNAVRDSLSQVF